MRVGIFAAVAALAYAASVAAAPPPNDDCANATAVGSLPFSADLDTREATQQSDDPVTCGSAGGPTVWYRLVPNFTGYACARTCGSSYDTVLAAVPACAGAASSCNDDDCGVQSRIFFPVTSGTPVLIEAAQYGYYGYPGGGGGLHIEIAQ